jgi:hypothetical protein
MRVCRSRQDLTFQYPCSPLIKGGEGREWGDSTRAEIREPWSCDWYKCLCDMIATCESGRHKTCPYKVGVAAPP